MANLVQSLQSSLNSIEQAQNLIIEQLRSAIRTAIHETAKELDDKKSAQALLNYLTDTFSPEPVSCWVSKIKYAATKIPEDSSTFGPKTTEERVVLVHSYFMSGCSSFEIDRKFLTALVAKITEK